MPPPRRIAVLLDPERIDLRWHHTLRGIARHAQAERRWHVTVDPFADRPGHGPYHGLIAPARRGRARSLTHSPVPVVCVTWGLLRQRLARGVENRYAAARLAARHLADRGCRSFAYLGFTLNPQSSIERHHFRLELRKRGLRIHRARTFVSYGKSRRRWERIMAHLGPWLERLPRPAGLFVARPGLARTVADLALARGLRIPADLAIIAADNDPVLCELAPPLTAIHFDYADVGHRAAQLLDRLIDGQPPPRRAILIEPTLVPRESTDLQTLADPLVARALTWIDRHCTDRLDWHHLDTGQSDRIGPRHVAAAVGIGQRALGQRMRRARGRTLIQELTRARVDFARIQLEHSDSPLPAIAHESALGSPGSMLRAFRLHLGATPRAIRRAARLRQRGR